MPPRASERMSELEGNVRPSERPSVSGSVGRQRPCSPRLARSLTHSVAVSDHNTTSRCRTSGRPSDRSQPDRRIRIKVGGRGRKGKKELPYVTIVLPTAVNVVRLIILRACTECPSYLHIRSAYRTIAQYVSARQSSMPRITPD